MTKPHIVRAAKWLLVAYALAFAVNWVLFLPWDLEAGMIIFGIVAYFWQIAPAVASVLPVRASRTVRSAGLFLLLEIAIMLFSAWAWYDLNFVHLDPQNPIALMLFLPLYELMAIGAAFVTALLLGWRAREA